MGGMDRRPWDNGQQPAPRCSQQRDRLGAGLWLHTIRCRLIFYARQLVHVNMPPIEPPIPAFQYRKDSRTAVLFVGRNPIGLELTLHVDGGLLWSRTLMSADEFRAELEHVRGDFVSRGWAPVSLPTA